MATATPFDANFIATLDPGKAREWSEKMEETLSEDNKRSETDIAKYRDELKAMDDAALIQTHPNARAIVDRIMQIRKNKTDEKMIVVAHKDAFLDAVAELLEREFRKNEPFRRSVGRIDKNFFKNKEPDHTERYYLVRRLNDPADDLGIMLLSALDGNWHGLHMQGASTLILCDPIWSHAVMQRVVGTIRRLGQTRPCTIYDCGTMVETYEAAKAAREMARMWITSDGEILVF
ncbi:hypothetical protein B0T14DRAFT_492182 [Immersiella caudata]|uniref:Helicase C-terminal domain-containing protein n=1 Tax=Immersiella caudata TaxID=314043 RepID=A0AA39XJF3_9PEZI|nr:hypothetical protein B0T14DRAFT_492182 [Immersiella caudata]